MTTEEVLNEFDRRSDADDYWIPAANGKDYYFDTDSDSLLDMEDGEPVLDSDKIRAFIEEAVNQAKLERTEEILAMLPEDEDWCRCTTEKGWEMCDLVKLRTAINSLN